MTCCVVLMMVLVHGDRVERYGLALANIIDQNGEDGRGIFMLDNCIELDTSPKPFVLILALAVPPDPHAIVWRSVEFADQDNLGVGGGTCHHSWKSGMEHGTGLEWWKIRLFPSATVRSMRVRTPQDNIFTVCTP